MANEAWINPSRPNIFNSGCPTVNFSHDFKTYYRANIAVSNFAWDFGEPASGAANTSTLATPSHSYSTNNTFTVTLTVTDQVCGYNWTNTKNVTIGCVLPVEWLNIDAKASNGSVKILWSTASEYSNDHFEIQRSTDGKNFTAIGTVAAKGTSLQTSNYQYTDKSPGKGPLYYRIQQTDVNGESTLSDVATAFVEDPFISITPNPSEDNFKINYKGAEGATIIVTDVLGKEIYSGTAGSDFTFGDNFLSGTYFVKINFGDNIYIKKIIKK
ncbi:MAG: T9SS type A sorting domain-containing protein [Cytophagaceae bacterium]|nr:T9SS type A sorting domain-containing protein [Cytophagaceae bacterium]